MKMSIMMEQFAMIIYQSYLLAYLVLLI